MASARRACVVAFPRVMMVRGEAGVLLFCGMHAVPLPGKKAAAESDRRYDDDQDRLNFRCRLMGGGMFHRSVSW